jgi:L-aminopeptidase/D-esterase-like protein
MNRRTLMAGSTALTLGTLLSSARARSAGLAAQVATPATSQATKPRARELGIPFDGVSGPLNAITDVAGVSVAHLTLIEGEGALDVGTGPIRTGLTAVLPRPDLFPVFGGWDMLNGTGEMTGTEPLDGSGFLIGPARTTNTLSVGVARNAVTSWACDRLGADLTGSGVVSVDMLSFFLTDPLLDATVQATEEVIVNALVTAETMTGIDGSSVHALPHDRLQEVLSRYNRLAG